MIMIPAKMYHFQDEISLFMSGSGAGGDGPTAVVTFSVKQSRFVTNMAFSSSVQLSLFAQ